MKVAYMEISDENPIKGLSRIYQTNGLPIFLLAECLITINIHRLVTCRSFLEETYRSFQNKNQNKEVNEGYTIYTLLFVLALLRQSRFATRTHP